MLLRNRFVLSAVTAVFISLLAGCGSNSNRSTPPPSGSFSVSSFNGSYAFSSSGTDSAGAPFALAGSVQANGSGGITGGTLDLNDAANSGVIAGATITGGNYTVTSDGRGKATMNTSQGSVSIDFVLLNSSHALITRYDNNGTGSGTMDIQSTVSQSQLAGSYAFSLGGIDSNGNPLATVGSLTLDSAGNITAGVQDFNDAGLAYSALTLTGNLTVGSGSAAGKATLTATNSSSTSPFNTLTFDVYAVDSTHLKFVETDSVPILSGDAFTQNGASLPTSSTTLAFILSGGSSSAVISTAGYMTIDGAGTITSGAQDINNTGTVPGASISFTGTYAAGGSVGMRTLINLTSFSTATQLVGYPTANAGMLLLQSDNSGTLLIGAASPQTSGASLAASQGYGMNISGTNIGSVNGSFEEDDIAEFTTSSNTLTGLIDYNDEGSLSFDRKLSGNYVLDSPATGRGELTTTNSSNGIFYAVDNSTLFFLETDGNQIGSGTIELQTPGSKSQAAASHAHVLHLNAAGRAAVLRRKK